MSKQNTKKYSDDMTSWLVSVIKDIAKEHKIHPSKVTLSQYNKLVKSAIEDGVWDNIDLDRVHIDSVEYFNAFRNAHFPRTVTSSEIEIAENKTVASKNKSEFKESLKEELFFKKFEEVGSKIFSKKIVPAGYAAKNKDTSPKERELNLILSDLHFHSLLSEEEVPHRYGPLEEARRMAAVILQACDYKRPYRKDTTLNIHLLGDIIQNQLHDPRDGAPMAVQSCASIYLLSQAVAFAATQFPKVVVRCVTGNHGRNTGRHHGRATLEKYDSIETIIYYSMKQALRHLPNVTVLIPKTPYLVYESFGMKAFGTHGDTVLNPGNPGSSINIRSIENQINRINASLKDSEEYKLFFVGHVHVGSFTQLPNGATFVTNGALIPPDSYSVSIGIFENSCGQTLFESVKGYIFGDYRFIRVNSYTDKDKSLDKIIKPFSKFDD